MKKIYGFLLCFLMACIYFASICYSISNGASSAVIVEPSLSVTAASNGYVCTGSDLTLSSSVSGGSSPYTYSWSGPNSFSSTQANPTISGSTTAASGTYFVTVTDHVSNTATASTSVTVSDCHVTMSLQNCSQPSPNSIQFDLYAVSDGAAGSDLRANSFQYGINYNTGILQSGAATSVSYVSGSSDFIPPLNGFSFPSSFFPDHFKILQNPFQGTNTGTTMTLNHQYKVGTFRFTSSSNLVTGSSPNFSLQSTVASGKLVCAEVVWFGSSTQTATISDDGTGNNQRTVSVNCSVTLNTCNFTASATSTPISTCNGNNGTATASASGGFSPFNYLWNNGQTTSTATGLTIGSYTVTVTDAISCTATASVSVTQLSALSISCSGTNISCSPGNDGTVSVTASGGGTPYSYLWSNGQTTSAISSLSAGTYTVTVTDAGGCSQTCSFTINPCNHLTLSLQNCVQAATNVLQFDLYAVSDGSLGSDLRANSFQYGINFNTGILQSGATIAASYVNGTSDLIPPLNGFTFPSTTFPDHIRIVQSVYSGSNTGTTMVVGHPYKVGTFLLTSSSNWVNSSSPNFSLQSTNVTNKTNTGGLVWIGPAVVASNFFTTGTGNGQRSLSVSCATTLNTCGVSASTTVTADACFGGSNGTATISASGGWPPYSYLWSNGQTTSTSTGLTAGSYSVTVTDAISCTFTASATVTQPTAVTAGSSVVTNASCNGGGNGSVSVAASGGTSPYSGTGTFTGLTAGTYTYVVTDSHGCTATTTITITQPTALTASSLVVTNVTCHGGSNGSVTVAAGGGTSPYTGAGTFTGLSAGAYTYIVTDANGCTATTTFTITEPAALLVSCNGTNVSCSPGNDGTVSISASGGTPAYTYLWSNGGTTSAMSGLTAGIYSATVTDTHGCTGTCTFTVKPCNHITLSLQNCVQTATNVVQFDLYVVSDGSFESDLRANSFQYGVNFNTGILQSGATITPSYVNNSSDLIPPLNGFTFPSTTFPDHIRIVQSVYSGSNTGTKMIVGHQYKVGTFLLTGSANWVNNSSPNFVLQSTTVTNKTNSGGLVWIDSSVVATNFFTTGTGNGQRSLSVSCSITLNSCTVSAAATSTPVTCAGGSNGTATVSATGGWPPYSYLWSNGQTTTAVTGFSAGSYSVTVTDAISCTATTTVTVTEPTALTASSSVVTNVSCHGGSNGSVSVGASGGTTPYSGTGTFTGLAAGTYTYIVTDSHGCTSTTTATATEPTTLSASSSVVANVSCHGGSNGSVSVGANGGTAPYSGTGTFSGLAAGSYTYIVTDAHGCTATTTVTVTQPTALTASSTVVPNVSCNGGSNGSVSVAASGGTATYSGTGTFTGLVAGTYTYIITDAHGCTATTTVTVTQPTALTASSTVVTNVSCHGGGNGSVSVVASGGTATYSGTGTFTGLVAGTYTYIVTDTHGCTATTTVTVTQPAALTAGSSVVTNVSCKGGSNGSVSVGANGGTAPYSGTGTFSGLAAGTYTYIVTDTHGCTATTTATVTEPTTLTASSSAVTNVSCYGGSNGSVSVAASGGTTPYIGTGTFGGLAAGTYTYIVTDAHGCTATTTVGISQPATALTASCSGTDVSCSNGSDGSVSISASGGVPSYTYLWSNGATASSVTNLGAATYSVTVTDAHGCTNSCAYTVNACNHLTMSLQNCSQPTCNTLQFDLYVVSDGSPGSDLRANAFQYGINFNTSILQSGATITPSYVSGSSDFIPPLAGFFFPASGSSDHIRIIENAYTGSNTGTTMTVGHQYKVGTFTLTSSTKWVANSTPAFALQATASAGKTVCAAVVWVGNATLPVTISTTGTGNNQRSVIVSCSQTLNPCNLSSSITSTNASCFGGSNGTATVSTSGGCNPAFQYLWSNGQTTQAATGLSIGSYMVTVTSDLGCTATASVTISQPTALTVSCGGTNASCNGGSNGSASITASGGSFSYTYTWSNGGTTSSISGLTAATYSVTVSDAHGCTASCSYTVTQPTALSGVCSGTNVSCNGGSNGSASVAASGGTASYSYTWNTGATASFINGLSTGTYSVTVTDSHGCASSCSYTVTQPTVLSAGCSGTNVSCHGGSNGSASVAASGGTPSYSYTWNTGATTSSVNGLLTGTYSVTVSDSHGCTASCSYSVTQPPSLSVTCSGSDASCNIGNDGSASVTASGGTVPYSYLWINGQSTSSVSNLTAGVYSVTVSDAHGCTNSCSYTVNACSHLTMSLQNCSQPTCNTLQFDLYVVSDGSPGSDLRANAFQYGINFNTSILQSGATITPSYVSGSSDFIPPLAGFFFPASGSSDHIRIVENAYTGSNTGTTMAVGHQYKVGTFTLTSSTKWVANSTPAFALQATASAGKTVCAAVVWVGNATLPVTISTTGTGNNQRSVIVSCSQTLNPCNLSSSITSTNASCFGGSNGTATVSTSGGCNPAFQYLWSNGQTTQAATGLSIGSYMVTVTSDLGCTATASVTISQPTALTVSCGGTNASCNGGSNGSASITASGGSFSYTYTWSNGGTTSSISGLTAATYSVTVSDAHGCTTSCSYTVTENPCPFATLNLTVFLEGIYTGSGTMRTTLYNLNISSDSTACDTIEVNLWNPSHLSNVSPDYSGKTILHSNGSASLTYPFAVIGNNWYIAVKHRSSIETWSHDSVLFGNITSYNFSDNILKAYSNGLNMPMKQSSGVFLFYSGDINQDGTVDVSDMAIIDNDASQFLFGYNASDCNGNGATDAGDMSLVDNNTQLLLFFARPY